MALINFISNKFKKKNLFSYSVRNYSSEIEQRNKTAKLTGNKIFIACFPKSGSTFTAKSLSSLLNYEYQYYFELNNVTSLQNLSQIKMVDQMNQNEVIHQHITGANENIYFLNKFGIKPIILVRNIFDCLVSLREHMHKENKEWPFMFYVGDDFFEKTEDEQYDFLIDLAVPWYLNFFTSWQIAIKEKKIDSIILSYEEMVSNKIAFLSKILQFYNFKISKEKISRVIEETEGSTEIRFSVGKKNRGEEMLSKIHKEKIKMLTKHYKGIDFSIIGI